MTSELNNIGCHWLAIHLIIIIHGLIKVNISPLYSCICIVYLWVHGGWWEEWGGGGESMKGMHGNMLLH